MTKPLAPFRFDIVGSFLRPDYLKEARAQFAAGTITQEELTATEDKAIIELIEKEKAVGLNAVTDGEFRRSMWHLDFLAALDGVKEVGAEHWSVEFKGHQPKSKTVVIDGTVDFNNHPAALPLYQKSCRRNLGKTNHSFPYHASSYLLRP